MVTKTPTTTTQKTEVKLPAWVDAASQKNYRFAEQVANKPYNPYTGETVAPTSDTTFDAYDFFKNSMGTGTGEINDAATLQRKAGAGILGMDRAAYTNPWTDEVENKALGALDKSRIQSLMGNADAATRAKAFGGTRSAVVDAVTNSEAAEKAGMLSANLRREGFDKASSLMQGDISNALGAGQGLLASGEALQTQRGKDFAGLLGIGSQEQLQAQKGLDAEKAKFDDAEGYDLERLNILLSSLGMSPYGKSESTNKTTSGGGGTDYAQMGLGIASLLMGVSDRDEKTDIKKIGHSENLDVPIYSYRYKDDPKTYPKVVGPMAQDIEKRHPGTTRCINGKLTVPMGILANA